MMDTALKYKECYPYCMCTEDGSLNTHTDTQVCVCSHKHPDRVQLRLMTKSITRLHCLLVILCAFLL